MPPKLIDCSCSFCSSVISKSSSILSLFDSYSFASLNFSFSIGVEELLIFSSLFAISNFLEILVCLVFLGVDLAAAVFLVFLPFDADLALFCFDSAFFGVCTTLDLVYLLPL